MIIELLTGVTERNADRLGLDDTAELATDGLFGLVCNQLEAVKQRQAGLDATHDDVDCIGKIFEEIGFAPLFEERQQPARYPESSRKGKTQAGQQAQAEEKRQHKSDKSKGAGDDEELLLRPGQARLLDADVQRDAFFLLLTFFVFFERSLDVAARFRRRGACLPLHRVGARDTRDATLGFSFAREQRIDKNPEHAANRKRHQEK